MWNFCFGQQGCSRPFSQDFCCLAFSVCLPPDSCPGYLPFSSSAFLKIPYKLPWVPHTAVSPSSTHTDTCMFNRLKTCSTLGQGSLWVSTHGPQSTSGFCWLNCLPHSSSFTEVLMASGLKGQDRAVIIVQCLFWVGHKRLGSEHKALAIRWGVAVKCIGKSLWLGIGKQVCLHQLSGQFEACVTWGKLLSLSVGLYLYNMKLRACPSYLCDEPIRRWEQPSESRKCF